MLSGIMIIFLALLSVVLAVEVGLLIGEVIGHFLLHMEKRTWADFA